MRAIVLEETGPPERLTVRDLPEPELPPGHTRVRVRAAAVNFMDVLVRQGRYPQPPPLPWVPGAEVAGETEDGRRVLGLLGPAGGGYAEVAAVEDGWLFELPPGAGFEEGAGFLLAFLTAWLPLTRQASVRPGSRVLVTAAAGGVGSAAVQTARLLGAEVVALASTEEKLALPRSLGAAETATYAQLDDLDPVDVVFDPVGGELLGRAVRLLRPLGAAVAVGFAGGAWPPLDPALLVGRNVGLHGIYVGRLLRLRPDVVRTAAGDLLRLWGTGDLRPHAGPAFPLADAAAAHRLVEERRSTGRVVLVVGDRVRPPA